MVNLPQDNAGVKRSYREDNCPQGMQSFTLTVKDTDLWVAVDGNVCVSGLVEELENYVWRQRACLEKYLEEDPIFHKSLTPRLARRDAPQLAVSMARAANRAGVGPMAAVAGAFALLAGEWLLDHTTQVIVENGGDIFCCCTEPVHVGVYAGTSPFSGRLLVEVDGGGRGKGICTSSATVGPSYSKGRADAAVIVSPDVLLADAVATATANKVCSPEDLERGTAFAMGIEGVEGVLVIMKDKLAACGNIQLRQTIP